jgi:hypothetical protein
MLRTVLFEKHVEILQSVAILARGESGPFPGQANP